MRAFVVVALLFLVVGCVEESADNGLSETLAVEGNLPPTASVSLEETEGRVPFYPVFTYACNDPEDKLKYCEVYVDGEKIASWGPFPKSIEWPEDKELVVREPGEHTITVVAIDDTGQTGGAEERFFVRKEIRVFIQELPTGIDPSYKESIEEGLSYWEKELGVDFVEVEEGNEDVYIDWAKEYAGDTIGRAEIGGKRMIVGLGDSYCFEKYRLYKKSSVRNIAIHELGHILGYGHVNKTGDFMNPIVPNVSYDLEINESLLIPSGYYWYIEPCSSNATFEVLVESDRPINIYQVASKEDYENALAGKPFKYNENCHKKNTYYFDNVCEFGEGNLLMLSYKESDAAKVQVVMRNLGR